MYSVKFHFSAYIVEAIAYHHSPVDPVIVNRDIVNITYLANAMCLIEAKKFDYLYFEDEVLSKYGLAKKENFDALHAELAKQYSAQSTA